MAPSVMKGSFVSLGVMKGSFVSLGAGQGSLRARLGATRGGSFGIFG